MKPAGFDGEFDWDFLLPAFKGTKITPMDLDAVIERRGHVLILETKSPGKDVPMGQRITLETLVKIGAGKIKVYFIYGKNAAEIEGFEEWYYLGNKVIKSEYINCDSNYIINMVSAWHNCANTMKEF